MGSLVDHQSLLNRVGFRARLAFVDLVEGVCFPVVG